MLHSNISHYQFLWIFHDKIQSYMHNFTLFSREKEWYVKWFHSFQELKSEFSFPFTHFENEKWNENALRSRSRMKSEMKIPKDRDREWKVKWKCLEIEKWNFPRILEKFLRIKKSRHFKMGKRWFFLVSKLLYPHPHSKWGKVTKN